VTDGEELRDRPAGVVADEVDLVEPEAVAQVGDDLGQRGDRQVGAARGAAVQRQVDRDAAARVLQVLDDVPPEQAVGAKTVHEQRDWSSAELGVGDVAGRGVQRLAVGEERADVHEKCLRS